MPRRVILIGVIVILVLLFAGSLLLFRKKPPAGELPPGEFRPRPGAAITPPPAQPETALPPVVPEPLNLTAKFGDTFAQELIRQNETGLQQIEGQRTAFLQPETIVRQMVEETTNTIRAQMPVISERNFRVVAQTNANTAAYLTDSRRIINNVFGGFPQMDMAQMIEDAYTLDDYSKLQEFSKKLDSAFKQFQQTSVPSGWTDEHKRTLELLAEGKIISDGIATWQSDPLRGLLALQYFGTFAQNSTILMGIYGQEMERLGI